jgi:hypothetical protein
VKSGFIFTGTSGLETRPIGFSPLRSFSITSQFQNTDRFR